MTFIFNYLILVLPSNFTVSGVKKSKKYLNLILNAIVFKIVNILYSYWTVISQCFMLFDDILEIILNI